MSRLERPRNDRVLVGVCAAVARSVGVPADLVRVAWLLAVPLGGVGVVVYVAAALLLPEATAEEEAEPTGDRSARNGGLLLVALAVLIHLTQSGFDALLPWAWGRGTLLPILVLGAGVLLLWPAAREALGVSPDRRVRRSVTDRVIAGTCGGIAREAGVDANWVRLAFVMAAAISWIAILLYALMAFVLPEEDVVGHSVVPEAADQAPVEGDR